ncbi:SNF1-related protein kinase catalytic subunit alpha KIN10 [Glycine soja]
MDRSTGRGGGGSVDMFLRNYKLGKTLGIGSFGKVKIAEHVRTGHKVAIKILNRHKIKNMEMEEKETPTDIYVVMEYVKSGELFDYIVEKGRLQEDEARHFFQQIISGVEYCHRNMVVHRDLKPENLLLDSKFNIKIADFGLSNIMRDGHFLKTSCGSPNYAAPEVISGKLYAGPEVDVWSCGVILYALLCGTLPFDDENIPNLFKKIKKIPDLMGWVQVPKDRLLVIGTLERKSISLDKEGGIYTLPSHLSPGARDLIPRMLVVDPMKRMTIPEIRQHPWFQVHLPRYLAVPPPDTLQQAKKIDEEILQEVVNMGFDRNQLVESLSNRIQNEGTVTYYLLLDNRFRVSSGYLGAEFQETMDSGFNRMHSGEVASPVVGHHSTGYMDYQGVGMRQQFPVERKWALGLQSRAQPREIMTEVLKALQELNVCWKKIGHYNMKCRWVAGTAGHHEGMINNSLHSNHYFGNDSGIIENEAVSKSNVVKFEVQLYKTREEKYLLDLQRVQGPQFLFLDLCAAFLSQLRVL